MQNNLTPQLTIDQLKANIDALQKGGKDTASIQSYVDQYQKNSDGTYGLKNQQSFGSKALGVLKDVAGSIGKSSADIGATAVAGAITPVQYGINQIAGRVMDRPDVTNMPISDVYQKAREQVSGEMKAPSFLGDKYNAEAQDVTTIPGLKKLGGEVLETGATVAPIGRATKMIGKIGEAATVGGLFNLGSSIKEDKSLGETVVNTAEGAALLGGASGLLGLAGKGIERLMTPAEELVKNKIIEYYNKAVKPTISGKGTAQQVKQYEDKMLNGVQSIIENKPNLKFTDEYGDIIQGEAPKSLSQASEAIEQTKKSIFQKYDEMAKKAGESGASVTTQPVIDELNTIINNKSVALANPKAITYAKELMARLAQKDAKGNIIGYETLTPSETQDVIQHLNKSLESFYKNPTYDSATQAGIDALFANKLREGLDSAVSKLSGEYQTLKNQYGALSTIEKDVVKASLRDARKNIKGLVDFSDVLSGGELVSGLLTMNPATIAKAGFMKAVSEYIKYLNNPNRIISKVFQNAEKLPTRELNAGEKIIQNVPNQSPKNTLLSKNPNPTNANIDNINPISDTISQVEKGATTNVEKSRLISEEAYDNAKKNFRENMGRINSGIPVDQIKDLTVMAAYHIENGVTKVADLAVKLAEAGYDLSKEQVQKLLKSGSEFSKSILKGAKLPAGDIEELQSFKGMFDTTTGKFTSPEAKKEAINFLKSKDLDIRSTKDTDVVDHIDNILSSRNSLRKGLTKK